jgi:hypothetical protein
LRSDTNNDADELFGFITVYAETCNPLVPRHGKVYTGEILAYACNVEHTVPIEKIWPL